MNPSLLRCRIMAPYVVLQDSCSESVPASFVNLFNYYKVKNICILYVVKRGKIQIMQNTYIIYVDVFFTVNFIMDYLLLYLTSKILKKKYRKVRLILSAFFGGIYSVIVLVPLINHLSIITLFSIITAFIMTFLAFGFESRNEYLKNAAFLGFTTFLLSGIMNYLYYSTEVGMIIQNVLKGTSNKSVNTRKFFFVTLFSYGIMIFAIKLYRVQRKNDRIIFDVKLSFRGKSVVTKGLFDTGNSLKEPISGKIVHVAESRIIKPMIEGDDTAVERICVIPYHSVGEETGMLYGYRLDEMVIIIDDKPKFLYKPIIAVYEGELSVRNKYGIILNGEIMEIF